MEVEEGAVWDDFLVEEGGELAQSLLSASQQEMSFCEKEN